MQRIFCSRTLNASDYEQSILSILYFLQNYPQQSHDQVKLTKCNFIMKITCKIIEGKCHIAQLKCGNRLVVKAV